MNKVEITNELLARIYGAYIGCEVKCKKLSGWTLSQHTTSLSIYFLSHFIDRIDKLVLTPLSEITDEDAVVIGEICGYNIDITEHGKEIANYIQKGKKISEFTDQIIFTIDFLRSKGYDTGFAHIPSLISAGIAIKKN